MVCSLRAEPEPRRGLVWAGQLRSVFVKSVPVAHLGTAVSFTKGVQAPYGDSFAVIVSRDRGKSGLEPPSA